jgi:branched-chain amino acid aminotransferase
MAWKESTGKSWTWYEGKWHEGNPMLMGPMTHAPWLGSCIFDGARAFEGTAPDLDLHCRRAVRSAETFGLRIVKSAGEIEELIREGIAKFPKGAALYLRPMFWAASGFVDVDPESTQFSVSL